MKNYALLKVVIIIGSFTVQLRVEFLYMPKQKNYKLLKVVFIIGSFTVLLRVEILYMPEKT